MLELLEALFGSVVAFFIEVDEFINAGFYAVLTWFSAKVVEEFTIASLEFFIWALPFAWSIARQIMVDLNMGNILSSAWATVDSNVLGAATLLRIPESVNILISAAFTKYVLRFIPFV